jgi:uncharacterized membrane protein (DUF106 family)
MIDFLAQLIAWINVPMNALSRSLLGFIGIMPGWASNTIMSAIVGFIAILIFKYTSNQKMIGKLKDSIKANMLALKLFKDSISVTFQSQGRLFKCALLRLLYSIQPMLVMFIPFCLICSQMGVWYQARPLLTGEQANIVIQLSGNPDEQLPNLELLENPAYESTVTGFKIPSKRQLVWKIKADRDGLHKLSFSVNGQTYDKDLVIGDKMMRVSEMRPGWNFSDILFHPWEKPFKKDSIIQSISIEYPERTSYTSGTDWWIFYLIAISMIFGLIFMPLFKVKI